MSKVEYASQQTFFISAQESYNAMKERYDVGMATYFELSTTLAEMNIAEFNLIRAKYRLIYTYELIGLILKS